MTVQIYRDVVRTIKSSEQINERTLEKFKLEEEFFKRKYEDNEFDWGVVTQNEINSTKALNIGNLMDAHNWNVNKGINDGRLKNMISFFKDNLIKSGYDIESTLAFFNEKYSYSKDESINFLKFLIIRKDININLEEKLIKDFRYIQIKI